MKVTSAQVRAVTSPCCLTTPATPCRSQAGGAVSAAHAARRALAHRTDGMRLRHHRGDAERGYRAKNTSNWLPASSGIGHPSWIPKLASGGLRRGALSRECAASDPERGTTLEVYFDIVMSGLRR
ncbi:hypothetical protein [Micromonospora sp. NPDC049645]|uniref:hypothetical protein n=1 Tax=Micromonospora sp. NPDC049645 TaxID=3155508 RepID=UPI00341E05D8